MKASYKNSLMRLVYFQHHQIHVKHTACQDFLTSPYFMHIDKSRLSISSPMLGTFKVLKSTCVLFIGGLLCLVPEVNMHIRTQVLLMPLDVQPRG